LVMGKYRSPGAELSWQGQSSGWFRQPLKMGQ
jgi:hypothetical protein